MVAIPKPVKGEKKVKKKTLFKFPKEKSRSQIIKEMDKVVSDYVRDRDEWKCCRCHTPHPPGSKNIHCSHFWGRGKLGTRWDLDNLIALCMPCHFYHWEKQKNADYKDYMIRRIGQEKMNLLEYKAKSVTHFSLNELKLLLLDIKKKYGKDQSKENNG